MAEHSPIYVITPTYKKKPEWLDQCVQSVNAQTVSNVVHLIVNDGDTNFIEPNDFNGKLAKLHTNCGDYGNMPRWIGKDIAIEQGAKAIAFLDADNWFEPNHLESALARHLETRASVIVSQRTFVALDGEPLGDCPDCGTDQFADTSAMVFFPPAFGLLELWGNVPHDMHEIADRILWNSVVNSQHSHAFTGQRTLNYRCRDAMFYEKFGKPIPTDAIRSTEIERALERWKSLTGQDLRLR